MIDYKGTLQLAIHTQIHTWIAKNKCPLTTILFLNWATDVTASFYGILWNVCS